MPAASRPSRFLNASEAAALLGVSRNSLYSYVSRGRIRAEPDPRDPRLSRYVAADVVQLCDRKEARLRPEVAAQKSLQWGMPVLESTLTLIEDGRYYYRGQDALALARRGSFEDTIRVLWNTRCAFEAADERMSPRCRQALRQLRALPAIARMQAILPFAAADDPHAADTRTDAVVASGWRIVTMLATAATLRESAGAAPVAARLADGWGVQTAAARRLIDMALVLCADHELNVSAFAARVVASARSSPYDVVSAALGAVRGPLHGGHSLRVEDFLDEVGSPDGVAHAMRERLRRGEHVPGFGHPLYANGDPRARALFTAIERQFPHSDAAALLRSTKKAGRDLLAEHANVDYALVLLRRALGLPRGCGLVLFAIGRTAGWLAHAMEQYGVDRLIRPRATYKGVAPAPVVRGRRQSPPRPPAPPRS